MAQESIPILPDKKPQQFATTVAQCLRRILRTEKMMHVLEKAGFLYLPPLLRGRSSSGKEYPLLDVNTGKELRNSIDDLQLFAPGWVVMVKINGAKRGNVMRLGDVEDDYVMDEAIKSIQRVICMPRRMTGGVMTVIIAPEHHA